MAFEKFTQTGKSYKPKISIRSNGQIGFNFGAIEKFGLANYKYAVLFFDREEQKVGIQLTESEEKGISCKLQIRDSNASISAKAFLDYFEINYKKTRRYEAIFDAREKMIIAPIGTDVKAESETGNEE